MTSIELPATLSTAHALIQQLYESNHALRGENEWLRHRLDVMARRMFGRRSELLNPAQLQLAFEALEKEQASDGPVDDEPDMPEPAPVPSKKPSRRHEHGRTPLPAHLLRDVLTLEPQSTICGCCGKPMSKIGEETAEKLEYVPASYRVQRTVRPKYACGTCKEGVVVAPAPVEAIPHAKAGPGLLAHVAVSKFSDHLPLYRQCGMLEREGIELSDSTVGGWIRQVADVLRPVAQAQWESILESKIICADETTVRFLTPKQKGSDVGWLWAYLGDRREVCFDFTVDRAGEAPLCLLREFKGQYLQVDGYAGYDATIAHVASLQRVACWAHARRKFYDAQSSDPAAALAMLASISRLYDVERAIGKKEFEDEGARAAALLEARQTKSKDVLDEIKKSLDLQQKAALPKSPLGQAVGYALGCWVELCRYIEDAAIPIDNNAVEREMRAVALGRKNWMFCGSRQGGKSAAVLYGLLGTCKLQGVNGEAWLRDVLVRLPNHPTDRLAELTPRLWKPSAPG